MESQTLRNIAIVTRTLLLAGFALATLSPSAATAQEVGFIEVSGDASKAVEADRITISFSVETAAEEARAASEANADQMDAVFRALRGGDLPDLVLETFGYSLSPQYRNPTNSGTPMISGYRASNAIRVTSSGVDEAGRIIDLAIGAGANRVMSMNFSASDTEQVAEEVLALATADAQRKAQIMADALGRVLGRPLEVRGGSQRPSPRGDMEFAMAARAAPTPIEAGDQVVRASVTIRFELGPPR